MEIKELREFYGLQQEVFADYLAVSRSHLSMAESGKRVLPTKALLKIARLIKAIPDMDKLGNNCVSQGVEEDKTQRKKLIAVTIKNNEQKIQKFSNALSQIKSDYERGLRLNESLKILKVNANPHDKGLNKIIEKNANAIQQGTGIEAQLKLELRIRALQSEIEFLRS